MYHQAIAEIRLRLDDGERQAAINSVEEGLAKTIEPHATFRQIRDLVPTRALRLEIMLARLYLDLENGNVKQARDVLEQAVDFREQALGAGHFQTAMAQLRLGEFLVGNPDHFDEEMDTAKECLLTRLSKAPVSSRCCGFTPSPSIQHVGSDISNGRQPGASGVVASQS